MDKLIEINRTAVLRNVEKTEEDLEKCTQQIIEWLEKQPHISFTMTQPQLELVLLQKKFQIEKVKCMLDVYFSIKQSLPEVFDNWDPTNQQVYEALHVNAWLPLPKMTANLERVTLYRLLDNDPKKFTSCDMLKAMYMIIYTRMLESEFNMAEQIILDLSGFKFVHLTKLTKTLLTKFYILIGEGTAARISGIHYLNLSPSLEFIISLSKIMFKQKILDRLHVHKDLSSLHEVIPKDILPKEYGGTEFSYLEIYDKWIKRMTEYKSSLMEVCQMKSDESKRIKEIKYDLIETGIEGINGSFKKLEID